MVDGEVMTTIITVLTTAAITGDVLYDNVRVISFIHTIALIENWNDEFFLISMYL